MPAEAFADTNVVLYLMSDDVKKAECAESLLPDCCISVQVLNEIANVARRKLHLSWNRTNHFLSLVASLCAPVEPLTLETHHAATGIAERYNLSFYDSLIAASAWRAGCGILYSEDMQHGLVINERLRVCNPFLS